MNDLEVEADRRMKVMREALGQNPRVTQDSIDPAIWYTAGYYVGFSNNGHTPDWGRFGSFKEVWEMGKADGEGDRELVQQI